MVEHDEETLLCRPRRISARAPAKRAVAVTPKERWTIFAAPPQRDKRTKAHSHPQKRRKPTGFNRGRAAENPENIDVTIPLGVFFMRLGVSGSGKSSLVNETL